MATVAGQGAVWLLLPNKLRLRIPGLEISHSRRGCGLAPIVPPSNCPARAASVVSLLERSPTGIFLIALPLLVSVHPPSMVTLVLRIAG
jgi:hypothetical protein